MRVVQHDQLPHEDLELIQAAERASRTATATYSGFCVGAAVRIERHDGQQLIVTGNNYETANYSSVCAEKHAIMRAFATHSHTDPDTGAITRPRVIEVAVYCATGATPQQPCGDCRQMLSEIDTHIRVISASGPRAGAPHDPRVSITTLRELLPYNFALLDTPDPNTELIDSDALEDYIVHLPKPADLAYDAEARAELLHGIQYLLLVGSPARARKVAQVAADTLNADIGCYCDLAVPRRDEIGREYALHVVRLPDGGPRVGVVSHGIGLSGVEIVLSEVPALIHLASPDTPPLRGVIRAGTRGTLTRVPLGCIALSTSSCDDHLDPVHPDPDLTQALREAAAARGMTCFGADAIDDPSTTWPDSPQDLLVEGKGLSSAFFWRGQGRPLYRPLAPDVERDQDHRTRRATLDNMVRAGVHWVEMEDYTVHQIAAACGYPSASLGAVIAHRRDDDGNYQLDYSKAMYKASEMLPTLLALGAFAHYHAASRSTPQASSGA